MYRSLPDNRFSDTVSQKWLNKPLFLFRQSVYPQNPLRPLRCCWSLEIKTNQPTNTQPNIPPPIGAHPSSNHLQILEFSYRPRIEALRNLLYAAGRVIEVLF